MWKKERTRTKIGLIIWSLILIAAVAANILVLTEDAKEATSSMESVAAQVYSGYRDTVTADEAYYEWNENTIASLTDDGKEQTILIVPARCEKIDENAFEGSSVRYLFFEDDDDIDISGAFRECAFLIYAALPEGLTEIGDYAFWNCTSLTTIDMPEALTRIGISAFQWCENLSEIICADTLTAIDERAFYGCSKLSSITIPETVEIIAEYAFYGCSELTEISIGTETQTSEYSFSKTTQTE